MDRKQQTDDQLEALAEYLRGQRAQILEAFRSAVKGDPELSAPSSLPRRQFNDHIPELLDAYEQRLRAWPREEGDAEQVQRKEDSAGHGLQRWQQGYHLREVTREWGHLQSCVASELENYALTHADLQPGVMPMAWRSLAELCSQGVSESTSEYFHLQQTEAEGHVRDLEQTLEQVRDLERRRAELFRQAAHDLRGNFGVVRNVTTGLTEYELPDSTRNEFLGLLQKSVSSLHSMLDEVMDLARLQAGQELRCIEPLDAAAVLRDLVDHTQPLAKECGVFLKAAGPETLAVEGDAIKLRRIAQNLVLNALKFTQVGGVTVSWGDSRSNDALRWMVCVEDTGPGFHAGPGAPLAGAMEEATDEARHVEEAAQQREMTPDDMARVAKLIAPDDLRSVHQERGEGIGLSIVNRLCELLDATVEMESKPGVGTTFRVVFPREYPHAEPRT